MVKLRFSAIASIKKPSFKNSKVVIWVGVLGLEFFTLDFFELAFFTSPPSKRLIKVSF